MPAQVIVRLIADSTGLQPGIEDLEQLGKVDKDTADQFKATNKAFADRAKTIQTTSTSTDKLAEASKKLVESIAGGAISQATKNIEKLGAGMDNVNAETNILNKTLDTAKQKLSQLGQGTPEFDKLAAEISAAELALGNLGNEASSSRGKLRQYRETLLQLEDAGLDGTQVFEDLANAAGALEDQVGDTQARIKVLASDTFKFDVAIQAVQGVAGAFSVAQGAAALFGSENEDLQKALLKVNAAMSILQGLQAVQAILQKESALNIGATIALQKLAVVQTNLQAAAESRFVVVRYAAVAAQRVLNLAMSANPAGAVLFAIAALATGIYALTRNTNEAADAQKRLNDNLKFSAQLADEFTSAIGDAGDVLVAQLEAQGAEEADIRKQRIKTLKDQLAEQERVYAAAKANFAKYGTDIKNLSKEELENRQQAYDLANDAAGKYFATQKALEVANLNDIRDTNKEREEAAKKTQEDRKNAQEDARKNTEAALRDAVAGAELQLLNAKTAFDKLTAQIVLSNAKLKLALANPDLGPNARALAEAQAAKEIKDTQNELLGDLTEIQSKRLDVTKNGIKEEVLASARGASEKLQGEQNAANAAVGITEDELAKKKALRDQFNQQLIESSFTVAQSLTQAIGEINRNAAEYELSVLQDRLDKGLISQKEYERKSKEIKIRAAQQEKQLAIFQATINAAAAIVKVFSTTGPPLSFLLAATTAAATLAQIAAISSKPLPAFKKGTKNAPGGPSLIGEAGPELYYADGKWGYAAGPTVLDLPKGAKVLPSLETSRIMNKYDIPLPRIPSYAEVSSRREKIDYDRIGAAVGKQLEKLPLTVFGYDKDGPFQHVTSMQNRIQFLNKRFGRNRR